MSDPTTPHRSEPDEWAPFVLADYEFDRFAPGATVVDVGCGPGAQVAALEARGCFAVGVDTSLPKLRQCRRGASPVVLGKAEGLPFRSETLDGVVCKVALPYTAERAAIAEIARVLKPGGKAVLCCHGAGYYLRHFTVAPSVARLVYAVRALVNTWWYVSSGRRLPGFLGDTLYQSRRRLDSWYRAGALELTNETPAPTFLGLPVFLYHEVTKRDQRRHREAIRSTQP